MPEDIFGSLPPETQMKIALICNSDACKDAKNQVITSRNDVMIACSDVKRFENDRTVYFAVAGGLGAAATTLWIAGANAPWPVNLIGFIVAAVLTILSLVFSGLAADATVKLGKAKEIFATAEQMFKDAVAAVMKNCDINCYSDLTVPTCP